MTAEHLRPLLDAPADAEKFCGVCEGFARAQIPDEIMQSIRMGRIGDFVRRLVHEPSRNNGVQQWSEPPHHQFALSTKAGCECVAHVVQGLTDLDADTTLLSVHGIGAFDLVSRAARQFSGSPSTYWWDDEGVTHEIRQGEGGEQGDALMPVLFSLGLHVALCAVNRRLFPSERFLAFLDDICALCKPERVSEVYVALQEELWAHSRIQIHPQLWNRSGSLSSRWQALTAGARISDPEAVVWRGDPSLTLAEQGVKVLGTPLGHTEFLKAQLREVINSHSVFCGKKKIRLCPTETQGPSWMRWDPTAWQPKLPRPRS